MIGEIGDTEKKAAPTFQAAENAQTSIRAQMTEVTVDTSVEEVKVVSPPKPDNPIDIVERKKKGPDPIPASRVLPDLEEEVKQEPKQLSPPEPMFTP